MRSSAGISTRVPLAAAIAGIRRVRCGCRCTALKPGSGLVPSAASACRAATLVTSVSRYTRARLLAWADVAPHRVRVLPNTVDAAYAPRPKRGDLVARYGLEGRHVILTVGRLSASERYKGHDRVIAALPGILDRVPDAAYLIVGSGDDQPRLDAAGARRRASPTASSSPARCRMRSCPTTLRWPTSSPCPAPARALASPIWRPLASGLPVIAGNADGSVDALADGRIGRLVDPLSVPRSRPRWSMPWRAAIRMPQAAEEARRFAFPRFAAHVDALVAGLGR